MMCEVRKQEEGISRVNVKRFQEVQKNIEEEKQRHEVFLKYQEKKRMIEELAKAKEELIRMSEEVRKATQMENETREREDEERKAREKEGARKARERGRFALEVEQDQKRFESEEEERVRRLKQKIKIEEKQRAEEAVRVLKERLENAVVPEPEVVPFDRLAGTAQVRKRFNIKDFENSNTHCVMKIEEEDESEDANERAVRAVEEREVKRVQDALYSEDMRARSVERGKQALNRAKAEKEMAQLEKQAREERLRLAQDKIQADIALENMKTQGMKQVETEKKFHQKKQEELESDFTALFYSGAEASTLNALRTEDLGERIELMAYWRDPGEIVYETKKTMEWGPKNKKRDFQVPDIDKIVEDRRNFRSHSNSLEPRTGGSLKPPVDPFSASNHPFNPDRDRGSLLSRQKSGGGMEEISFNYTEDDGSYYPGIKYTKEDLLHKYRSRDGVESPRRTRPNDQTLEMTLSEDLGESARMSSYPSQGRQTGTWEATTGNGQDQRAFLHSTDINKYLEEQQEILARLEKDRKDFKRKIEDEEDEDEDEEDEEASGENQDNEEDDEDEEDDAVGTEGEVYGGRIGRRDEEFVKRVRERSPEIVVEDSSAEDNGTLNYSDRRSEPAEEYLRKFMNFRTDDRCKIRLYQGMESGMRGKVSPLKSILETYGTP